MPRVSVLLPTYNGQKRLHTAIKSVMAQSFHDWELIIIDDGSSPPVQKTDLAVDHRIILLRHENNCGIQKARYDGLQHAQGEYVANIDDDDEWIDLRKLEEQVDFLDHHPDFVLTGTGTVVVDDSHRELFRFFGPENDDNIRRRLLRKNCFTHSGMLFRRDAALKCGGYRLDPSVRHVEDYDLWLRLGKIGKMKNLHTYAVAYMHRAGNIGSRYKKEQFKHDILLSWKYRKDYPCAYRGITYSIIRFGGYIILSLPLLRKLLPAVVRMKKSL